MALKYFLSKYVDLAKELISNQTKENEIEEGEE